MFSARLLGSASAFAAATLFLLPPAAAQTTVIGFTSGAYDVTDTATNTGVPSYSLGFEFTANSASSVTSLGYFNDPGFDPKNPFNSVTLNPKPTGSYSYTSDHQVGLYQIVPGVGSAADTGLLLGSTLITSGSTADGSDFLYNTITPIVLVAGDQYVIAGVSGAEDPYLYNVADDSKTPGGVGLTVNSAITYNQDRYASSSTLAYPSSTDGDSEPGFFGPNFKISLPVSAAPEPGEWSVLGFAALSLGRLALYAQRRSLRSPQSIPSEQASF